MLFPRPGFDDVLDGLLKRPEHRHNVTLHEVRPAKDAVFGDFPEGLAPELLEALARRGITHPYRHQADAMGHVLAGRHLVLTTPTASGKTLCYNAPVLDRILREPDARALYLFPTKALSQDQYTGLHGLISETGAKVGTFTFDGDTPPDARKAVRDHGHVVITNPDMLHSGVLPQHTKWVKLFENLRYVVVDELHTYRGIFGSHVAHVLHRLRRIARFYGSDPQFICCSATIANPVGLAERLTGLEFAHVAESTAPRGEHHVVCYNPPVVNAELGIRAGVVRTATKVATELLEAGVSTIVFASSRLQVEILLKYLREALVRMRRDPEEVQGYRGGYLPNLRRRIEAGLRTGNVKGVVATNALELGLDIGSLDACVIAGYPGSIASLWQQSGRAGRRSGRALTVYVARSSAIDQYMVTHPRTLLEQSPEHARVDPKNLFVLVDHVKCAAFELPFEPEERYAMLEAGETSEVLSYLSSHRVLHEAGGRFHWTERVFPAHQVNLRGIPEENFVVIDVANGRVLAEVDFRSAHTTLHTHAIHNIDGRQYQVERLDYDNHKAYVRWVEPDYYTTAITYSRVGVLDEDDRDEAANLDACAAVPVAAVASGEVLVSRKVVGFKKVKFHTNENVGYGDIHLPDQEMHTTACWLTIGQELMAALRDEDGFDGEQVLDGLVGLSHALHVRAAVVLMCATRDLGRSVSDPSAGVALALERIPGQSRLMGAEGRAAGPAAPTVRDEAFDPTLFLYDAMPGGVGLAEAIHAQFEELLEGALGLVETCACQGQGCPACLGAMPGYDGRAQSATRALGGRVLRGLRAAATAHALEATAP